jgi:predicted GNAT family acetyltransferase
MKRTQYLAHVYIASDPGRRGIQHSGIKEEAEGRGTAAELGAMSAGVSRVFMAMTVLDQCIDAVATPAVREISGL